MTKQLNKNHAIVHTATIDVKVLRLDKKQMTLSVFRQLDEELIFTSDGTLRGTPWGRVNYLWPGCREGTVFHVVWQDGDKLKRSPIPAGWCNREWVYDVDNYDVLMQGEYYDKCSTYCRILAEELTEHKRHGYIITSGDYIRDHGDSIESRWGTLIREKVWPILAEGMVIHIDHRGLNELVQPIEYEQYAKIVRGMSKKFHSGYLEYQQNANCMVKRFRHFIQQMNALDQLFIAV